MILQEKDNPAQSSEDILQGVWDSHCRVDSWNFITSGLHNGDLFIILCMIRSFRASHLPEVKVHFVADTVGKFALLRLFEDELDLIAFSDTISQVKSTYITEWCVRNGREKFLPGSFLRLHPLELTDHKFSIAPIVYSRGLFNLAEMFKTVLDLPLGIAPISPTTRQEFISKAAELFNAQSLKHHRTVVLFPYARTLSFDAMVVMTELAALAAAEGFKVCSAVYGLEAPVPGTHPVELSFEIIIPFCELAGNVVALRSGIGDILSSGRLRKVNLYSSADFARYESPNAYGMCDCSSGVIIEGQDTRLAAALIWKSLQAQPFSDVRNYVPETLVDYFRTASRRFRQTMFSSATGCKIGRYMLFNEAVLAEGWSALEEWGVWSIGFRSICYMRMPEAMEAEDGVTILEFDLRFSISGTHPELFLSVDINGRSQNFNITDPAGNIRLTLTEDEKLADVHRIVFNIHNPRSPTQQSGGINLDTRLIGVGLVAAHYLVNEPTSTTVVL